MHTDAKHPLETNRFLLIVIFLIAFNAFVWVRIYDLAHAETPNNLNIYFLDVGQGDSALIELPNTSGGEPVQALIDGGPNQKVVEELEKILPAEDRYIDLVFLTHPQLDHYGGLIDVMKRYRVGMFIFSGRDGSGAFDELEKVVNEQNIPVMQVSQNDRITFQDSKFSVLSPTKNFLQSAELNETSLVMLLESKNAYALFTGDIDKNVEDYLASVANILPVDILKVPHHGSRFSSNANFLNAIQPKISVIEVGVKNTYGHPTKETLTRLQQIGASIYRTDQDGTVQLIIDGNSIKVKKESQSQ